MLRRRRGSRRRSYSNIKALACVLLVVVAGHEREWTATTTGKWKVCCCGRWRCQLRIRDLPPDRDAGPQTDIEPEFQVHCSPVSFTSPCFHPIDPTGHAPSSNQFTCSSQIRITFTYRALYTHAGFSFPREIWSRYPCATPHYLFFFDSRLAVALAASASAAST